MKAIKALLILVLTLFWGVISLLFYSPSPSYTAIAAITTIYGLLIYLIWPIGTPYSEKAYNRFLVVLGIGAFLIALNVLLSEECPSYPSYLVVIYPKQSAVAALILLVCTYLGKYPASLLLIGVGCYFIYRGYTLKPSSFLKQALLQKTP